MQKSHNFLRSTFFIHFEMLWAKHSDVSQCTHRQAQVHGASVHSAPPRPPTRTAKCTTFKTSQICNNELLQDWVCYVTQCLRTYFLLSILAYVLKTEITGMCRKSKVCDLEKYCNHALFLGNVDNVLPLAGPKPWRLPKKVVSLLAHYIWLVLDTLHLYGETILVKKLKNFALLTLVITHTLCFCCEKICSTKYILVSFDGSLGCYIIFGQNCSNTSTQPQSLRAPTELGKPRPKIASTKKKILSRLRAGVLKTFFS